MKFTKSWSPFTTPSGEIIYRPNLGVFVRKVDGLSIYDFIVDSGADLSMAPYGLFRRLGKRWEDGEKRVLRGISPKEECVVEGRVHDVDILIWEIGVQISIPMCFAKGEIPFLLGREGFFDYFLVSFDKPARKTIFDFVGQ